MRLVGTRCNHANVHRGVARVNCRRFSGASLACDRHITEPRRNWPGSITRPGARRPTGRWLVPNSNSSAIGGIPPALMSLSHEVLAVSHAPAAAAMSFLPFGVAASASKLLNLSVSCCTSSVVCWPSRKKTVCCSTVRPSSLFRSKQREPTTATAAMNSSTVCETDALLAMLATPYRNANATVAMALKVALSSLRFS
jgi:hypothetical protein